ncbi:pyruvate kinase [Nitrospirillum viridazoti Y2]|nr:pyruvate kinase [Nitrospirillum amazonense Y2]
MAILAITADQAVSRRLCLLWGTHSALSEDIHSYEQMVEVASAMSQSAEFAKLHDQIIVVAGIPFAQAGTTNNLRMLQIGG